MIWIEPWQTFIQNLMNKQANKSFEQARQTHEHPRKLFTRMKFGLARKSIYEIKKMSHSREER